LEIWKFGDLEMGCRRLFLKRPFLEKLPEDLIFFQVKQSQLFKTLNLKLNDLFQNLFAIHLSGVFINK